MSAMLVTDLFHTVLLPDTALSHFGIDIVYMHVFNYWYTPSSAVCMVKLQQYIGISIYRNTDCHNMISIHPITVSIYRIL